ncbi:hypothetical protein BD779DRAFT_1540534 [Infundibulicybe gibba]|nr:hypothetical protein BD779DRAFT_1540534 [Infundibulicybe gibba]
MAPKSQHPSSSRGGGRSSARKAAPKKPLTAPERLKRLFTSLCAQIDGGHFNNAVKTCDKILRIEPGDKDAIQTKLFVLLQTEAYDTALSLIDSNTEPSDHAFEPRGEGRDILSGIKEEKDEYHRGFVHLEAQLNYREGSYQAAFDLYNELLDTAEPQTEEHTDILTNLQATQHHLDFINTNFLHALDNMPASVTATIESVPPPAHVVSTVLAAGPSPVKAPTAEAAGKPAIKKARASRVPAGVIPGVTPPPDPERWLKKSERSTFGQGRRRKGASGGATQGSAAVESTPASGNTPGQAHKSGSKGKKKK